VNQKDKDFDYDYFEVSLLCGKSEIVSLEDFMLSIGACSVTYRDAQDVAILEPAPGKMPLWQDIEITAMFTKDYHEVEVLRILESKYKEKKIKLERLKNQVWERTWLEHFKPMQFGENTWIIPSEYEAVDEKAINIYLDPGMAFGTGTHATTALCLQWIDAHNMENVQAIDFGCGSGILAIAALKHGANKLYCTDIDPQAIESTVINATSNSVIDGIEVVDGKDVTNLENLDIVLANILAAPLMTLVEVFSGLLKDKGELIMSGILKEQTDEIVEKFKDSFVDFEIKIMDDWACVYCIKKS
jgi:ribosomal protein L11 methyltransferase